MLLEKCAQLKANSLNSYLNYRRKIAAEVAKCSDSGKMTISSQTVQVLVFLHAWLYTRSSSLISRSLVENDVCCFSACVNYTLSTRPRTSVAREEDLCQIFLVFIQLNRFCSNEQASFIYGLSLTCSWADWRRSFKLWTMDIFITAHTSA